MPNLRTCLALSRAADLPTVWSNCLAGWWLGGGGFSVRLPLVLAGATFLYLGGAFLHDVSDERFDREFRRARPLPSGAASPAFARGVGWGCLIAGEGCLFAASQAAGVLGLALAMCALAFNATHRLITFSPVLLGACRLLLYVLAATAGADGVTGWALWCGVALAVYVAGARWLPRAENTRAAIDYWPVALLAAPICLAVLLDVGHYRLPGLELSAVFGLWVLYCLRYAFWPADRDYARAAGGLVAGIVFADWLAALDVPRALSVAFLALFGASLLLQRAVPR